MPSSKALIALAGSARSLISGSELVGPSDPKGRLEVTIDSLRNKKPVSAEKIGALPLSKRHYLTREEFATAYGATVG